MKGTNFLKKINFQGPKMLETLETYYLIGCQRQYITTKKIFFKTLTQYYYKYYFA